MSATNEAWMPLLRAALLLLGGGLVLVVLLRLLARTTGTLQRPRVSAALRHLVLGTGLVVLALSILHELGFDLSGFLIFLTVLALTLGLAARSGLANAISGLFLLIEKPFTVGQRVRVGEHSGTVEAIGVFGLSLRTYDNLLVRVPHEALLHTTVVNLSRFPIRRMDLKFQVPPSTDLVRLQGLLRDLAQDLPQVLHDPEPLVLFHQLTPAGVEIHYGVWFESQHFVSVRNQLIQELLKRLAAQELELASLPQASWSEGSLVTSGWGK